METKTESSPLARLILLGLGFCAAIGAVFVSQFHTALINLARCPLRGATGIPCPTCGSTHALVALLQGQIHTALIANPLLVLLAVSFAGAVMWAVGAMVIPAWRITLVMSVREKTGVKWLVVFLLTTTWFYEIWRLI